MKRNTKIALVMMALSAMAMGSTSAFAHGGHGMWQQNAAPLTSEQQTAWQKIHNDFYAQSSALQQQLVTKLWGGDRFCMVVMWGKKGAEAMNDGGCEAR